LHQGAPPYALEVPVTVTTASGEQEHICKLDKMRQEFSIDAPGAIAIHIDPDYHLFRRLDPREIETTISQVLAEDAPVFSLPSAAPDFAAAAEGFARAFVTTELVSLLPNGELPVDVSPEMAASTVLLRNTAGGLAEYQPAGLTIAGSSVYLAGKRYSLDEYDLVYTVADPYHPHVTDLVVVTRSAQRMESLGRRLGHYGKYSWLLLPAGQGRVLKGNWVPPSVPLRVEFEG
jgi:hypothetical protein